MDDRKLNSWSAFASAHCFCLTVSRKFVRGIYVIFDSLYSPLLPEFDFILIWTEDRNGRAGEGIIVI